jgi:hypothetical protein
MEDFISFRKMITPTIVQVLFWVGVAGSVIFGLFTIVSSFSRYGGGFLFLYGLLIIIMGPILTRIYCELLILFFRMYDTLIEIKNSLANTKAK